jgi:hypothetical protein
MAGANAADVSASASRSEHWRWLASVTDESSAINAEPGITGW